MSPSSISYKHQEMGSVWVRSRAPEVETLRREVLGIFGGEVADRLEELLARVLFLPRTADALLLRAPVGDVPWRLAGAGLGLLLAALDAGAVEVHRLATSSVRGTRAVGPVHARRRVRRSG